VSITVLHVIDGLGTGGAERSLAELLPHLRQAGLRSSVVALHKGRAGVERSLLEGGEDVHFLAGTNAATRVAELRRLIRARRPDVVHTTLFTSSAVGRLAAAGTPARVLTSLVNTPYDTARLRDPRIRPASLRAVRAVDGVTARHLTDHFHAITHAVRDAAVGALGIPAERVTVVERGRDPGRLGEPGSERRRRARAALGLGDDDEVVLNVARQEFQKGQRFLLDAAGRLARDRPRLVVLLAGRPGDSTAELEARRRSLPPGTRVELLGHRDDLPEVLAAADVFAFPSLWEGLGCAVIEAMALGLPVVASDVPALREVLEDGANATLVPPADPQALAAALARLLDDPDRRARYGRRSRDIFRERFTLDRCAARMVRLFEAVAGGRDGEAAVPSLMHEGRRAAP
jgi:glycosyltransferase involved in cell wall biosynthesis